MATNTEMIKASVSDIALTGGGLAMTTVGQCFGFAQLMEAGGMLPKNTTVAGSVVAMVAGQRLGLDPFQAVQGIAVINGRPALWGDAMVGVVQASGLIEDEKEEWFTADGAAWVRGERAAVRYTVKRKGRATPYVGEFSKAMAEKAGLWGKSGPWTLYPETMLLNRARAFALRKGFADVLKGMRSAEEERDTLVEGVDYVNAPTVNAPSATAEKPKRIRASASELLGKPAFAETAETLAADASKDAPAKATVAANELPDL